jgi:hypothetical protein
MNGLWAHVGDGLVKAKRKRSRHVCKSQSMRYNVGWKEGNLEHQTHRMIPNPFLKALKDREDLCGMNKGDDKPGRAIE